MTAVLCHRTFASKVSTRSCDNSVRSNFDTNSHIQHPFAYLLQRHGPVSTAGLPKCRTSSCGGSGSVESHNFEMVAFDHLKFDFNDTSCACSLYDHKESNTRSIQENAGINDDPVAYFSRHCESLTASAPNLVTKRRKRPYDRLSTQKFISKHDLLS
jgi:hypothetical protein